MSPLLSKWLFAALLIFQVPSNPTPQPGGQNFRWQRDVVLAGTPATACALLDAAVFTHASPLLNDVRLQPASSSGIDLPYVLTVSEAATVSDEPATVINLGLQGKRIVFDLLMPARPYTSVDLHLNAANFVATASVSGVSTGEPDTTLGESTIFDLSAQHLGRNTTLTFQESTFARLHVRLHFDAVANGSRTFGPSLLTGAMVPPSREAQTLFTSVAEATAFEQLGSQSVFKLQLPLRVPVERVAFVLARGTPANFSRDVSVTGRVAGSGEDGAERITGEISRIHLTEANRTIDHAQLSLPAVLGVDMQAPATVEVRVENGDDRPLPIQAVQLQMRQRKLCFETTSGPIRMVYGDPGLHAPVYDFARLFVPSSTAGTAVLGPEQINPAYIDHGDTRGFSERHPELLWVVLLGVIGVLAMIAFRTARRHES